MSLVGQCLWWPTASRELHFLKFLLPSKIPAPVRNKYSNRESLGIFYVQNTVNCEGKGGITASLRIRAQLTKVDISWRADGS